MEVFPRRVMKKKETWIEIIEYKHIFWLNLTIKEWI